MRLHTSRCLTLFCGLMSVVLLAATAPAQQRARRSATPGGFAEGRLMKKKAKELGLSEDTVTKIDAAIKVGREEEAELRRQNEAATDELDKILAQNLPNQKELMAASNKVGEIALKSRVLKMKSVIEMRSLLTPEQLEKFIELRQKATARR